MHIQLFLMISVVTFCFSCRESSVSHPSAIFDPSQELIRIPDSSCSLKGMAIIQSRSGEATAVAIGLGLWLTNSHAMEQCDEDRCLYPVTLNGKSAELVKRRDSLDYAVLKVRDGNNYIWPQANTLDSTEGHIVRHVTDDQNNRYWAQSKPMKIQQSYYHGFPVLKYTINTLPGNSGSPLLNIHNEIIGIHAGSTEDGGSNFAPTITSVLASFHQEPVDELKSLLTLMDSESRASVKKDVARILYATKNDCEKFNELSSLIDNSGYKVELDKYFALSKRFDRQATAANCPRDKPEDRE